MATSTAQRTGIWIIAIALTVGTLAGFVAMIIAPANDANDAKLAEASYEKQLEEFKKQQAEEQKANKPLDGYKAEKFDADKVTKLKVEILKQGSGDEIQKGSKISADYFGWTSDGKIFDSTNKEGSEAAPVDFVVIKPEDSEDGSGVITGWVDGLIGQKVGSTVKLIIPSSQAYSATDDGSGRPVGPLTFIVEIKALVKTDE